MQPPDLLEHPWAADKLPAAWRAAPAAPFVSVGHRFPTARRRDLRPDPPARRARSSSRPRGRSRGRSRNRRCNQSTDARDDEDEEDIAESYDTHEEDYDTHEDDWDGHEAEFASDGRPSWATVAARGHRRQLRQSETAKHPPAQQQQQQQRKHPQQQPQPQHRPPQQQPPPPQQQRHRQQQQQEPAEIAPQPGAAAAEGDAQSMEAVEEEEEIGPPIPAPFVPHVLPRGLIAARHKALSEMVERMEAGGKDPRKIEEAIKRRDKVKQEAKIAGGLTQQKLNLELLNEARRVSRFEKAVAKDQQRLEQAQAAIEEARKQHRKVAAELEATKRKLANSVARQAHLATTLAAETNADRNGGIHATVASLRQALQTTGVPPELSQLWQRLEDQLREVAPPPPPPLDHDPIFEGLGESDAATSVADEGGAFSAEVGDLIVQSDLATAEADLRDLVKQQEAAIALAVRTNESQGKASRQFDSRIAEAKARIQRTRALFSNPARREARGASEAAEAAAVPHDASAASGSLVPRGQDAAPSTPPRQQQQQQQQQQPARPHSAPRPWRPAPESSSTSGPSASNLPAAFATGERAASARRLARGGGDETMRSGDALAPVGLPLTLLTQRRRDIRASLDGMVQRMRPPRGRSGERPPEAAPRSRSERGDGGMRERYW